MKSGNLNFLEPSGPLQDCNGTALHFYLFHDKCGKANAPQCYVHKYIACPVIFLAAGEVRYTLHLLVFIHFIVFFVILIK